MSFPPRQDDDETERRRLGERLREARKYLGLKQEEVATYLKIPRTGLTDIENGQRRVEAIELTRLARLYRHSTQSPSLQYRMPPMSRISHAGSRTCRKTIGRS